MKVGAAVKTLTFALLLCATTVAKDKPKAPLAPALLSAKTVMLQGNQQAVDDAFDELTKWGRFQIVTDKTKADLVFEFVYTEEPVSDYRRLVSKETLEIRDIKSGESVYQDSRSEMFGMARRLVKTLRKRLEQQ